MNFCKILDYNFIENAQTEANKIIIAERNQFSKVYETIINYVKEHDLILSDVNKLTNIVDETKKDFHVYTENPFRHAVALANEIHKLNKKYVRMDTIDTHKEFLIYYNFRPMVTIYHI